MGFTSRSVRRLHKLITRGAVLDPVLRTMPFGVQVIDLRPSGRCRAPQNGQNAQIARLDHFEKRNKSIACTVSLLLVYCDGRLPFIAIDQERERRKLKKTERRFIVRQKKNNNKQCKR